MTEISSSNSNQTYAHSETLRDFPLPLAVLDYETFYDNNYSLSKMTTEEYIRDQRFEIILVNIILPDGQRVTIRGGNNAEVRERMSAYPWHEWAVVCHHTMFDGAISSWILGIKPKLWLDTLSMARACGLHSTVGGSLKALAKHFGLQEKGTYVANMLGVHAHDMTEYMWQQYEIYGMDDCEITLGLFDVLYNGWYDITALDWRGKFPVSELLLIDVVLRMFTEPVFVLDEQELRAHLKRVQDEKQRLLTEANVTPEVLQSARLFSEALERLGVEVPMKTSPATGKPTPALAKTDQGMKDLLEHEDPVVQALATARLGVKSTLEESRTERFISISGRGNFPIPLSYGVVRTHRLAGTDKINLQNLPARGKNAKSLKKCIKAPPGYVVIDADSSNIEARGVAWLAGQDDLVAAFANKEDIYSTFAAIIYGRPINKKDDPTERFVGKEAVLGSGYGMGWKKFQATLKSKNNFIIEDAEAERIINLYRTTYDRIPALWRQAEQALHWMVSGQQGWLGREGVVFVDGAKGVRLPNGLYIQYPELQKTQDGWRYKDGKKGWVKIYGAKLIENVVQALARIIVMWQLVKISRQYKVGLTVHDAIAVVAPENQKEVVMSSMVSTMRRVPAWAQGWPVDCEIGYGPSYGDQTEVKYD